MIAGFLFWFGGLVEVEGGIQLGGDEGELFLGGSICLSAGVATLDQEGRHVAPVVALVVVEAGGAGPLEEEVAVGGAGFCRVGDAHTGFPCQQLLWWWWNVLEKTYRLPWSGMKVLTLPL